MNVSIKVYGTLREKLGWKEKTITLPQRQATMREILAVLGLEKMVLDEEDHIREGFIVFVNGVHAQFKGEGKTIIRDGDIIAIFPPGGGG